MRFNIAMRNLGQESAKTLPWILCILFLILVIFLTIKLISIRRAADELRTEFAARLKEETNVGISISTSDKKMKQLAADMDRQLKLLRKEHIRYVRGDQELKQAVTNISHDLRTPLTAIFGYLDLLSKEELPEAAKEYLAVMENRADALKELMEDFFRYSVVVHTGAYEEKEELSLNAVVEESIAGYYGALKKAGIAPEICLPEKNVMCYGNRQALSRILSNLISNAIKYSEGDFSILLEEDGTLHVKNRASGLDEVQAGQLFERYYTVEAAEHATGLGLSIAKALTEEEGGQITAEYREGVLHITLRFQTLPATHGS